MSEQISLREWAIENKVWEPKAWEKFLKDDIVPFYKDAYTLWEIYEFLRDTIDKYENKTLPEIREENELLYDKLVTAIHGGIWPNKDPNKSFAKFMYDTFGLQIKGGDTFKKSVEIYKSLGDLAEIEIGYLSLMSYFSPDYTITGDPTGIIQILESIIFIISDKLNIDLKHLGLEKVSDFPQYRPLNKVSVEGFLPSQGESPELLQKLINGFFDRMENLLVGVNPYTSLIYYMRVIPLPVLAEFFNLDIEKNLSEIKKLMGFLRLNAYSMITLESKSKITKNNAYTLLLVSSEGSLPYYMSLLQNKIKEMKSYLGLNDNDVKRKMWDQLSTQYLDDKRYMDILKFLGIQLKEGRYGIQIYINEKGNIIKVECGTESLKLRRLINLGDFLIYIAPLVSIGLLDFDGIIQREEKIINFKWEDAQATYKYISKVIRGAGKT